MFTSDAQVVAIGYKYLQIVGYFYFTFSIMFSFLGVFRGAGDTMIPMIITLFSMWIFRVPAAYFLSKVLGTDGIWWSIPTGWIFGLFASTIYFKMGHWKNKSIV
jgi:Na+-driven multidrug efflux pump